FQDLPKAPGRAGERRKTKLHPQTLYPRAFNSSTRLSATTIGIMSLPILKVTHQPTEADLIRMFYRVRLHWARHEGEETQLDFGTAFTNPELPKYANQILDAFTPEGSSAAEVITQAKEHFDQAGVVCTRWVLAPSVPESQTKPLADALQSAGYIRSSYDILH